MTVLLPAFNEAKDFCGEEELMQISKGDNQRVMLVDDDELVLDSSKQILKELGY